MALTANSTKAKINYSQLVDEITDDPRVAPNEVPKPEKTHNEAESVLENIEEESINQVSIDAINENREESSLSKRLAAQPKKTRGYQKSIYLAADTYDYVMSIADKYNIRISQVINSIIRDVKSHEE